MFNECIKTRKRDVTLKRYTAKAQIGSLNQVMVPPLSEHIPV
jgi:hypothetical protein